MAKPVDWIGPFAEEELEAAIAWRNYGNTASSEESRFEADGSTLRSFFKAETLPFDPIVQVIEIISCRAPVITLVTDGYTQISAKLSKSAVQSLEEEIDQKIDPDTRGDVVCIKDGNLTSTLYGPKEHHIQLEVLEIEYRHHLRKSLGSKLPILERTKVLHLQRQAADLLLRQNTTTESNSANAVAGASQDGTQRPTDVSQRPQSQDSNSQFRSSPPTLTQHSHTTQQAIATQLLANRKRKAPSLPEDGLEILQGNNLARPHGPGFTAPSTGLLSSKRQQSDHGTKLLLGLLKNQPKGATLQREAAPAQESTAEPEAEVHSVHSSPGGTTTVPEVSGGVEQMSIDVDEQEPAATTSRLFPQTLAPSDSAHPRHSSRRIPHDQKLLLDKASSWVRSLPGKHFPHPNVPTQLLQRWDELAQNFAINPNIVAVENVGEAQVLEENEEDTSDSMSEPSSSSENEELPWSQSPPRSQIRRRRSLPPDSTIDSNARASSQESRIHMPSDSPPGASPETDQLPPDSSIGSSIHSTPLQKRMSQLRNERRQLQLQCSGNACSTRTPVSLGEQPDRHRGVSQSPLSNGRMQQQNTNTIASIEQSSPSQRITKQPSDRSTSISRPPTSGSIVRGTQLQGDNGDVEMEISVPRSLESSVERPSVEDRWQPRRTERREHFKPIMKSKRKQWLKAKYTYHASAKTFSISTILAAYKGAHPNDKNVRLGDFAEVLEEAFPELYLDDSDEVVGGLVAISATPDIAADVSKSKPANNQAQNVRQTPVEEDIIMADTDTAATATATANTTDLRRVSEEPHRSVIDLANANDYTKRLYRASFGGHQAATTAMRESRSANPTSATFVAYASSGISDSDIEMLPNPAHGLNSRRPSNSSERKDRGQIGHRSQKTKSFKALERHVGPEDEDEAADLAGKKRGGKTTFEEFGQAMKNVRPGGAFVDENAVQRGAGRGRSQGQKGSGRLDVLDWDI